jgi:hypothetical protein
MTSASTGRMLLGMTGYGRVFDANCFVAPDQGIEQLTWFAG